MHHANVSTNYAWLPHNLDESLPTPDAYKGMPVQPFGNKQKFYNDLMAGCTNRYQGHRCQDNEDDRIEMSMRQPRVSSLILLYSVPCDNRLFLQKGMKNVRTSVGFSSREGSSVASFLIRVVLFSVVLLSPPFFSWTGRL
jgi:hypothetical protein